MNAVAKAAGWFTVDAWRLFSKDVTNALIASSVSAGKDALPSSSTSLEIDGALSDALGTYFGLWESAQMDSLHLMFQGSADSLTTLTQSFNDGMMLDTPTPDQESIETEIQHIIYSQMVLKAWAISPEGLHPFIL
jgi:hypothetical protein